MKLVKGPSMSGKKNEIEILDGLTETTKDQFHKQLSEVIERWLDQGNIEKISFYLYRIDVHEYKAGKVFKSIKTNHEKSLELATMMIERHLLKSQTKLS